MYDSRLTSKALSSLAVSSVLLAGLSVSQSVHANVLYFDFNSNTAGSTPQPTLFLFGTAGQTGTVSNNSGFRAESSMDLAGYWINRKNFTTDMTYLLAGDDLGNEYLVASYGGGSSQLLVQATQDATTVSIELPNGTVVNQTLDAGET